MRGVLSSVSATYASTGESLNPEDTESWLHGCSLGTLSTVNADKSHVSKFAVDSELRWDLSKLSDSFQDSTFPRITPHDQLKMSIGLRVPTYRPDPHPMTHSIWS